MTRKSLVRWTLAFAILNFSMVSAVMFARPDIDRRAKAHKIYRQGRALEREHDFNAALKKYEKIVSDYPETLDAPKAGFRAAEIYKRRFYDIENAKKMLERVVEFRGSEYAEKAADDLAFMREHWGKTGKALKLWYKASGAYRRGDYEQSAKVLLELIEKYKHSSLRPLAMYYAGKALRKNMSYTGAEATLRDLIREYPNNPYARRAERLLKKWGAS
ncbi:MAG: hypothetical protein D6679_12185 [Candidatus Hydrogenedentota bacterium]|nr:MAG: hypothetical protein D6679_12185 [Candidatus Hydrogenedentota bacterium]